MERLSGPAVGGPKESSSNHSLGSIQDTWSEISFERRPSQNGKGSEVLVITVPDDIKKAARRKKEEELMGKGGNVNVDNPEDPPAILSEVLEKEEKAQKDPPSSSEPAILSEAQFRVQAASQLATGQIAADSGGFFHVDLAIDDDIAEVLTAPERTSSSLPTPDSVSISIDLSSGRAGTEGHGALNGKKVLPLPPPHTSQLLVALSARNLGLTSIPFDFSLPKLSTLCLRSNRIQELPPTISGLQSLRILDLRDNCLTALPEDVCSLEHLENLDVFGNELQALPDDIGLLQNLEILDARQNKLAFLPESLGQLKNLRSLSLTSNSLHSLVDMSSLKKLVGIEIYDNPVALHMEAAASALSPSGSFPHDLDTSLKPSYLEQPGSIFSQSLSAAFSLNSTNDKCDPTWPALLPAGLGFKTWGVHAESTLQKQIDSPDSFVGSDEKSARSRAILLENLALSNLGGGISSGLATAIGSQCVRLELNYNGLKSLPENIGDLASLSHLECRGNALANFPESLCLLRNLEYIDVRNNRLQSLPLNFCDIADLRHLDLGMNELQSIPSDICRLANLTFVDLSHNRITHLPASLGDCRRITHAFFDHNLLEELPESVCQLENILVLSASHNKIRVVPGALYRCGKLHHLDLNTNRVISLPPGFGVKSNICSVRLQNVFTRVDLFPPPNAEEDEGAQVKLAWENICVESEITSRVNSIRKKMREEKRSDEWTEKLEAKVKKAIEKYKGNLRKMERRITTLTGITINPARRNLIVELPTSLEESESLTTLDITGTGMDAKCATILGKIGTLEYLACEGTGLMRNKQGMGPCEKAEWLCQNWEKGLEPLETKSDAPEPDSAVMDDKQSSDLCSNSTSSLDLGDAILEGFLIKSPGSWNMGPDGKSLFKKWQRRYFSLEANGILRYFDGVARSQLKGEIDLSKFVAIEGPLSSTRRKHVISLVPSEEANENTRYLVAKEEIEIIKWKEALSQFCCKRH